MWAQQGRFVADMDESVREAVGAAAWRNFRFLNADVRDAEACRRACRGVDIVLHQAALGSVPRSIADPLASHASNVTGHLNLLLAARESGVGRFVYASSSAVYGDHPVLPKLEERIGRAVSPYGLSKHTNELYAAVFASCYGFASVGLRYFNVFGPRQDPESVYAAVIPAWIGALLRNQTAYVNGDGLAARDFCYVDNVVQANLLAAVSAGPDAAGHVFNVAVGGRTTLNQLAAALREMVEERNPGVAVPAPRYVDFRAGDVRHSQADVGKASRVLGYEPVMDLRAGLRAALPWYEAQSKPGTPVEEKASAA